MIAARAAIALAVVLVAPQLGASPAAADDYVRLGHWPQRGRLVICATGTLASPTRAAVARWQAAGLRQPVVFACRRTAARKFQPTNLWVQYGRPAGADATAAVYTWPQNPHIRACVVTTRAYTGARLARTLLHELGHCWGLDHTTDSTSIMGGGAGINDHDVRAISSTYTEHGPDAP